MTASGQTNLGTGYTFRIAGNDFNIAAGAWQTNQRVIEVHIDIIASSTTYQFAYLIEQ